MKKRILFITQHLGRTGSEMVLWYLLINLNREKYSISVFCKTKGELYDLLPEHIEKNVMYKYSPNRSARTFRRLVKVFGINPLQYQLDKIQRDFKADIWYINTIAFPEVFELPKPKGVKIVTHVHELLYAFSEIKSQVLERTISYSDVCIGCSDVVCEKLLDLNHPNVALQYSFIDTDTIHVNEGRVEALKKQLGILPGDFVWVVSGGTKYMKGLDFVLPILDHFKDTSIKILWLGSKQDNALYFYVKNVAERKYPGRVMFTGALSEDYYNYMSIANGFLLVSREETFSLVMLEAAYLGIPIVAFDIGIARQFVQDDMGVVIEGWNIRGLFAAMQSIHLQPDRDKVRLRDAAMAYSSTQQLPAYEALLDRISDSVIIS
ncbi:glycosyltransferase family 4 protein [Pedobacter frigoris]|uniref:glycosyltransferase family 4 protein n=1 Tax=Pedobacter frigoris TaxID=2571272 RepID=UPI00292F4705|nr:glycosyltransferase family 4 protein [Pedobacter frigoris]